MPEAFAKQMQILWDGEHAATLLSMNEYQLVKELRRVNRPPCALDYKLRVKFWVEFERVQVEVPKMAKMNMLNILGLDYAKESFYRFYITDPYKLAFLLCPPTDYNKLIDIVLNVSTQKLLEVLDSPCQFPGGVIDPAVVKKFMEINETMHRRKLQLEFRSGGGKTSRDIEEPLTPSPELISEPQTEEEKKAEIERLKVELGKLPGLG